MHKLINTPVLLFVSWCFFGTSTLTAQDKAWTNKEAVRWVRNGEWRNGTTLRPHRTVNTAEFAAQYRKNKEVWDKVFTFLAGHNIAAMENGRYDIIKDRCWATVSEYIPKTPKTGNTESHKRFTDLQYVVSGDEEMGIAPHNAEIRMLYDENRDIAFYSPDHAGYFKTSPRVFFLFFPCDIHQPSVAEKPEGNSKKIVFKIEYLP